MITPALSSLLKRFVATSVVAAMVLTMPGMTAWATDKSVSSGNSSGPSFTVTGVDPLNSYRSLPNSATANSLAFAAAGIIADRDAGQIEYTENTGNNPLQVMNDAATGIRYVNSSLGSAPDAGFLSTTFTPKAENILNAITNNVAGTGTNGVHTAGAGGDFFPSELQKLQSMENDLRALGEEGLDRLLQALEYYDRLALIDEKEEMSVQAEIRQLNARIEELQAKRTALEQDLQAAMKSGSLGAVGRLKSLGQQIEQIDAELNQTPPNTRDKTKDPEARKGLVGYENYLQTKLLPPVQKDKAAMEAQVNYLLNFWNTLKQSNSYSALKLDFSGASKEGDRAQTLLACLKSQACPADTTKSAANAVSAAANATSIPDKLKKDLPQGYNGGQIAAVTFFGITFFTPTAGAVNARDMADAANAKLQQALKSAKDPTQTLYEQLHDTNPTTEIGKFQNLQKQMAEKVIKDIDSKKFEAALQSLNSGVSRIESGPVAQLQLAGKLLGKIGSGSVSLSNPDPVVRTLLDLLNGGDTSGAQDYMSMQAGKIYSSVINGKLPGGVSMQSYVKPYETYSASGILNGGLEYDLRNAGIAARAETNAFEDTELLKARGGDADAMSYLIANNVPFIKGNLTGNEIGAGLMVDRLFHPDQLTDVPFFKIDGIPTLDKVHLPAGMQTGLAQTYSQYKNGLETRAADLYNNLSWGAQKEFYVDQYLQTTSNDIRNNIETDFRTDPLSASLHVAEYAGGAALGTVAFGLAPEVAVPTLIWGGGTVVGASTVALGMKGAQSAPPGSETYGFISNAASGLGSAFAGFLLPSVAKSVGFASAAVGELTGDVVGAYKGISTVLAGEASLSEAGGIGFKALTLPARLVVDVAKPMIPINLALYGAENVTSGSLTAEGLTHALTAPVDNIWGSLPSGTPGDKDYQPGSFGLTTIVHNVVSTGATLVLGVESAMGVISPQTAVTLANGYTGIADWVAKGESVGSQIGAFGVGGELAGAAATNLIAGAQTTFAGTLARVGAGSLESNGGAYRATQLMANNPAELAGSRLSEGTLLQAQQTAKYGQMVTNGAMNVPMIGFYKDQIGNLSNAIQAGTWADKTVTNPTTGITEVIPGYGHFVSGVAQMAFGVGAAGGSFSDAALQQHGYTSQAEAAAAVPRMLALEAGKLGVIAAVGQISPVLGIGLGLAEPYVGHQVAPGLYGGTKTNELTASDQATLQILQNATAARNGEAVVAPLQVSQDLAVNNLAQRMQVTPEGDVYLGGTQLNKSDPLVQQALALQPAAPEGIMASTYRAISNTLGELTGSNLVSLNLSGGERVMASDVPRGPNADVTAGILAGAKGVERAAPETAPVAAKSPMESSAAEPIRSGSDHGDGVTQALAKPYEPGEQSISASPTHTDLADRETHLLTQLEAAQTPVERAAALNALGAHYKEAEAVATLTGDRTAAGKARNALTDITHQTNVAQAQLDLKNAQDVVVKLEVGDSDPEALAKAKLQELKAKKKLLDLKQDVGQTAYALTAATHQAEADLARARETAALDKAGKAAEAGQAAKTDEHMAEAQVHGAQARLSEAHAEGTDATKIKATQDAVDLAKARLAELDAKAIVAAIHSADQAVAGHQAAAEEGTNTQISRQGADAVRAYTQNLVAKAEADARAAAARVTLADPSATPEAKAQAQTDLKTYQKASSQASQRTSLLKTQVDAAAAQDKANEQITKKEAALKQTKDALAKATPLLDRASSNKGVNKAIEIEARLNATVTEAEESLSQTHNELQAATDRARLAELNVKAFDSSLDPSGLLGRLTDHLNQFAADAVVKMGFKPSETVSTDADLTFNDRMERTRLQNEVGPRDVKAADHFDEDEHALNQLYTRSDAAIDAYRQRYNRLMSDIKDAKKNNRDTITLTVGSGDRSVRSTISIREAESLAESLKQVVKLGYAPNMAAEPQANESGSVDRGLASLKRARADLTNNKLDTLLGHIMDSEIEMVDRVVTERRLNADGVVDIRNQSNAAANAFKRYVEQTYLKDPETGANHYQEALDRRREAGHPKATNLEILSDAKQRAAFLEDLFGHAGKLTQGEAMAYLELIARDPQIGEAKSGLKDSQLRMIIQIGNNNIALVAAGSGKTYPFVAVMTMRAVMGVPVKGRIIVSGEQEISKYRTGRYANMMRAGGLNVEHGHEAFEAGKAPGENYSAFTRQMAAENSVQVIDANSFGHSVREMKAPGRESMVQAFDGINTTMIDEADRPATSRSEYSVGREADADPAFKTHVIDLRQRLASLSPNYMDLDAFDAAGGIHSKSFSYTTDMDGSIIYTDALRNYIVGRETQLRPFNDGDLTHALRAVHAVETRGVVALVDGIHQVGLELQHQTKDQNDVYTIMAQFTQYAKTKGDTRNVWSRVGSEAFEKQTVKIMTHGEQATLGEGFTIKDAINYLMNQQSGDAVATNGNGVLKVVGAGTGTGAGVETLMETAYGNGRTVPVEDIQFEDSQMLGSGRTRTQYMVLDVKGEKQVLVSDYENGTSKLMTTDAFRAHLQAEARAGGRGLLLISPDVRQEVLTHFENEIQRLISDPKARDAALNEIRNIERQSQSVARVVTRDDAMNIEAVKEGQSFMDLAHASHNSVIQGIASRLDVIDVFSDPGKREAMAGSLNTGKNQRTGRTIISDIVGGRALSYDGRNNLLIVDAQRMDMATRTQADARTGRTESVESRFETDRHALLKMDEVTGNVRRFQGMQDFLNENKADPALQSIRKDMEKLADYPQMAKGAEQLAQQVIDKMNRGEDISTDLADLRTTLNTLDQMNADFRLLEVRSDAAGNRIGSESRNKLASEAIGQEIAHSPEGSADVGEYRAAKQRLNRGHYDTTRNVLLDNHRSPAEIATEKLRNSLQQSEGMWSDLAQNTNLSEAARARAALRVADIRQTLAALPKLIEEALKQGVDTAFAEIDTRNPEISRQVVEASVPLIRQMLPSRTLSLSTGDGRVLVEMANAANDIRDGGSTAVSDDRLERIGRMAQQAVTNNSRLPLASQAVADMASTNNPKLLREILTHAMSLNVTVDVPKSMQPLLKGQQRIHVTVLGQPTDSSLRNGILNQLGTSYQLASDLDRMTFLPGSNGAIDLIPVIAGGSGPSAVAPQARSRRPVMTSNGNVLFNNGPQDPAGRGPIQSIQGKVQGVQQKWTQATYDRKEAKASGNSTVKAAGYALSMALPRGLLNTKQQQLMAAQRFAETANSNKPVDQTRHRLMNSILEAHAAQDATTVKQLFTPQQVSSIADKAGKAAGAGTTAKQVSDRVTVGLNKIVARAASELPKPGLISGLNSILRGNGFILKVGDPDSEKPHQLVISDLSPSAGQQIQRLSNLTGEPSEIYVPEQNVDAVQTTLSNMGGLSQIVVKPLTEAPSLGLRNPLSYIGAVIRGILGGSSSDTLDFDLAGFLDKFSELEQEIQALEGQLQNLQVMSMLSQQQGIKLNGKRNEKSKAEVKMIHEKLAPLVEQRDQLLAQLHTNGRVILQAAQNGWLGDVDPRAITFLTAALKTGLPVDVLKAVRDFVSIPIQEQENLLRPFVTNLVIKKFITGIHPRFAVVDYEPQSSAVPSTTKSAALDAAVKKALTEAGVINAPNAGPVILVLKDEELFKSAMDAAAHLGIHETYPILARAYERYSANRVDAEKDALAAAKVAVASLGMHPGKSIAQAHPLAAKVVLTTGILGVLALGVALTGGVHLLGALLMTASAGVKAKGLVAIGTQLAGMVGYQFIYGRAAKMIGLTGTGVAPQKGSILRTLMPSMAGNWGFPMLIGLMLPHGLALSIVGKMAFGILGGVLAELSFAGGSQAYKFIQSRDGSPDPGSRRNFLTPARGLLAASLLLIAIPAMALTSGAGANPVGWGTVLTFAGAGALAMTVYKYFSQVKSIPQNMIRAAYRVTA